MKIFARNFSAVSVENRETHFPPCSKKQVITILQPWLRVGFIVMMILVSMTASAQLLKFNTFGNAGTETSEPSTFNDANIASTSLTYTGSTVTPAGNTNRFGGSSWGVGALNTAKYIQFIVTPNAGFSFTPTSLVFIWDFSGTGPSAVTLRSSTDGFATFTDLGTLTGMTTSTSVFKTINITALTNVTVATTFRLYGYNATAATGTGGFDCASSLTNGNIQFNGTTAAATPPVVTAESLTGTVGVLYNHNIIATNSPSSYTISTGTLPAGLSLNTISGAITGTPTTAGTSSVDIYASNGAGAGSAATINFTINPGSQTITGLAPTDNSRTFGDAPYNLTAAGGASGNPVTYTASPAGVVTIIGSQVTITGAGTTTITASQAGNTNYNAAADVTQTLNVNQAAQTISFGSLSPKPDNAAIFQLTATGGASGNPVTYTSSNTAVAIIVDNLGNPDPNGNWVDILAAGSTTITASQAGNTNYSAASPVQQVQVITSTSLTPQTITNFSLTDTRTYGDADYQLTATGGGSGNPVTYQSLNTAVATIVDNLGNPDPNGTYVHIVSNGVATIRASQAGNGFYNPAPDVDQVLTVNQKEITISGAVANDKPYDGTNTASITGYTVNGIVAGDNVTVTSGGTFASVNAGTWTVTAAFSISGTDASKYFLTQPTGLSATITQLTQVINFGALVAKTYGNPDFALTATGGASGNPVTYTSSDPSVATIVNSLGIVDPNGGFVHIVGAGSTTITASQLGNTNYIDATSVPQTQLVNPATQTISFAALSNKTVADAPFSLSAVSNSGATPTGLTITYTSSNPAVADVVGNVVTIFGRGTTDITASQSGNTNYLPATSVTRTLIVTAPLIAAWDFTGPGGTGITTFAASLFNADLSSSNLITRGATAAASIGANSFRTTGFKNDGISTSNTDYFQTTLAVTTGKLLSLSDIAAKFSGTLTFVTGSPATPPGGVTFQFAYSLDGTNFTPIGSSAATIGSSASTSATLTMSPIDLTGITALQNVPSGTTVTFRYYASGQTTTGGWGFFSAAVGDNGLSFGGSITNDCSSNIATADFRTKGSTGNFGDASPWEYLNSCGNWVDATQPPSADNYCICRAGFSGTKDALAPPMTIKGLLIESGSTLQLESNIDVTGTGGTGSGIQISGNLVTTHSGRLLDGSDTPMDILSGGTLTHEGRILKPKDEILTIHSGGTVISAGEIELSGSMTVNGQFDGALGKLTFNGLAAQVFDYSPALTSAPSHFGELDFSNTSGGVSVTSSAPRIRSGKIVKRTGHAYVNCNMIVEGPVNIDQQGIIHVSSTSELSVGGDMTVNGQYDGENGKLTLEGTTAQVIMYDPAPTSVASNFGEVSFSNTSPTGVHITSAPAAQALAIWLSKKGYDYYKASSDISMTFQESFTIGTGATMEVMGARSITVGGDWINNGGTFIPGTSTVVFNGTGTSHIGGTTTTETFYDLETSCTDLINDMSTLNVQNLKITGGKFTGGPGTVTMKGNMSIIDGAVFDPNQGTLVFDGTVEQELNDGGIASAAPRNITVHSVVINNPSDYRINTFTCCGVGLRGRVNVTGDLTFIAGKMKLNSDLYIEPGASITGTSPSKYIVTNGSASLHQILPISGAEVKYPIGSASGYSPVTNKLLSVTGQPVTIGARVADGVSTAYDSNENPIGSAIVTRNVLKTYFETGNIPTGDQITIHPQWAAADEAAGFNRAACNLGHYTGGQWVYSDATAAIAGDSAGQYTGTFVVTITDLSPFAVFSQDISNTVTGTTFCAGENLTVNYAASQGIWNAGNNFTAQLSDATGSFASPVNIGSVAATTSGTISATIPVGTPAGNGYRIRIVSDNTVVTGNDNGTDLTVNICNTAVTLNLTAFLEGFMDPGSSANNVMLPNLFTLEISTDPSETDSIVVNLWDPGHTDINTFTVPDYTTVAVLHTNGVATMQFPAAVSGSSWYIAVKHRSSIETWSKLPVLFSSTTEYDFSTGLEQAYDDGTLPPMKSLGGGVYAFYSGDITGDGAIDGQDMNEIDNRVGFFGYDISDVNGDGATDGQDMNFVDNNSQLGLFYARPY